MEQDRLRQLDSAKKEAENIIKSAQIDAAAEVIKRREQFTTRRTKLGPNCTKLN